MKLPRHLIRKVEARTYNKAKEITKEKWPKYYVQGGGIIEEKECINVYEFLLFRRKRKIAR